MISSKASEIDHKVVSERKHGVEGPTCNCFCDSHVQVLLGRRVRSSGDMQMYNVDELLDTLPTVASNTSFTLAQGYEKNHSKDVC